MKLGLIAALSLTLGACSAYYITPIKPTGGFVQPPARYMKNTTILVEYVDANMVGAICKEKGVGIPNASGCFVSFPYRRRIILPNPCQVPGWFTELNCHEIGHANGWGASHPLDVANDSEHNQRKNDEQPKDDADSDK